MTQNYVQKLDNGDWPSGKAPVFGTGIRGFKSLIPSQMRQQNFRPVTLILLLHMEATYNIVEIFLAGSVEQAKLAHSLETEGNTVNDHEKVTQYLSYVIASITQAVAALEAEAWNIAHKGPGHQLGSNGKDYEALGMLLPNAAAIDGDSVVKRYNAILNFVGKSPFNLGDKFTQEVALLVDLRNEVVHYKSYTASEIKKKIDLNLINRIIKNKSHFYGEKYSHVPFIQILGYDTAKWCYITTIKFLEMFYKQLGIDSPIRSQISDIEQLP
jgi:hypothetical protein